MNIFPDFQDPYSNTKNGSWKVIRELSLLGKPWDDRKEFPLGKSLHLSNKDIPLNFFSNSLKESKGPTCYDNISQLWFTAEKLNRMTKFLPFGRSITLLRLPSLIEMKVQ